MDLGQWYGWLVDVVLVGEVMVAAAAAAAATASGSGATVGVVGVVGRGGFCVNG